ncbi:MAG TPA: hypothetical protein VKR32_13630 [Puia sp.]|nr:hypothetical protein [Puia sp.]
MERVPMYRSIVKKDPVAEYEKKVDNNLNDWKFSVKLYETSKTFYYLIIMQYEEVRGEDTLRLPNLGSSPKPAIVPGKERFSCIVGFMDIQNQFNDYKLISVENGNLKVTTLKHYTGAVYTK